MAAKIVKINRAPVLTLWATIVAERLGYDRPTALTLGKAVAGLNAQAKGQRLGIFEKPKEHPLKVVRKEAKPKDKEIISLLGRAIPTIRTKEGIRARIKDEIIDPKSVEKYLLLKFGDDNISTNPASQPFDNLFNKNPSITCDGREERDVLRFSLCCWTLTASIFPKCIAENDSRVKEGIPMRWGGKVVALVTNDLRPRHGLCHW